MRYMIRWFCAGNFFSCWFIMLTELDTGFICQLVERLLYIVLPLSGYRAVVLRLGNIPGAVAVLFSYFSLTNTGISPEALSISTGFSCGFSCGFSSLASPAFSLISTLGRFSMAFFGIE